MREFLAGGIRFYFLGLAFLFAPNAVLPQGAGVQAPATTSSSAHPPQNSKSPQGVETPSPVPNNSAPQAIPLTQIAGRAEELDRLLREITSQLTPESELLAAKQKAETQAEEIRQRALQAGEIFATGPTPLELEDEQRYWRARSLQYAAQRKPLTALASKLEEQIQTLEGQLPVWQATWDAHQSSGIGAVVDRIREELEVIRTTRLRLQEQLNLVLTVQNQVSQQDQQTSDVLLRVRQVRERERSRLLEPDSSPIWRARQQLQFDEPMVAIFHRSFERSFTTAGEFLRAYKFGAFGFVAFYFLALVGVLKLRRYVHGRTEPEIAPQARVVSIISVPAPGKT